MIRSASFPFPVNRIALAAGLAVAVGLATPALAAGKSFGHHGPRLERAIERLELDDVQRTEISALLDAARPAGRTLHEQIRAAQADLHALLAETDVDESAVLAGAEQLGALRTELSKHRLRTLIQVRERLSPAQREQLAETMERRRSCRHGSRRPVL
jgi:Spy/CpxP family protein refolding chaperone